jgi:hypothetical protein
MINPDLLRQVALACTESGAQLKNVSSNVICMLFQKLVSMLDYCKSRYSNWKENREIIHLDQPDSTYAYPRAPEPISSALIEEPAHDTSDYSHIMSPEEERYLKEHNPQQLRRIVNQYNRAQIVKKNRSSEFDVEFCGGTVAEKFMAPIVSALDPEGAQLAKQRLMAQASTSRKRSDPMAVLKAHGLQHQIWQGY